MLTSYVKLAFRNFRKFRIYSIINLVGLGLGLTVGVLVLLFVMDELAFDKFHAKKDRIFKVVTSSPDGGMETNAWPVAYKLKNEYPEVESVLYTRKAPSNMMVNFEGKRFSHNLFYASEDFFRIFSFNLIEGSPETALKDPFSIVITQDIKQQYFGNESAVGKSLTLRDSLEFTITGVVQNLPSQSHIQFDMLASFTTYTSLVSWYSYSEGWGNFDVRNYVLLKEGSNQEVFKEKAHSIYKDNVGDWLAEMGVEFNVEFIPLDDIYLKSAVYNGFGPKGSIKQVRLVLIIGIFVILLACINFINITTARSVYRAKEVGLRKIIGSSRISLFLQFMMESLILTIMALVFVAFLVEMFLPVFNDLMGKNYVIASLLDLEVVSGILLLIIAVVILSGYYPAVVLSGFKPAEVLKGRIISSQKGIKLRKGLVIFQFTVTAILVLGTLIVIHQLDYMRNQDLGFDKEQILVLDATNIPSTASRVAFKNGIKSIAQIENISLTNALPGRPGWQGQWAYPEVISEENQVDTEYMAIDEDYISTFGLELIAGRNFDLNNLAELEEGLIINEKTVVEMGWMNPENALGKKIVSPSKMPEGTVIGVVRNYHGLGLQHEIWPKAMDYSSESYGRYFAIRFTTGNTSGLLSDIQKSWNESFGDYTFDYFFLDDDFDRQYKAEDNLMRILLIFAVLGVAIASIGLLGLISFMILTRHKEIGVRKVLGAGVIRITGILSREFLILVLIADILAIPVVWYFGNQWFENFAYHTRISPTLFIANILITILVAGLTISFQTVRAALMNPVDSLKNE